MQPPNISVVGWFGRHEHAFIIEGRDRATRPRTKPASTKTSALPREQHVEAGAQCGGDRLRRRMRFSFREQRKGYRRGLEVTPTREHTSTSTAKTRFSSAAQLRRYVDVLECSRCQGPMRVIACIEQHDIAKKMLSIPVGRPLADADSQSGPVLPIRPPHQGLDWRAVVWPLAS
jgi:hypothetical protein